MEILLITPSPEKLNRSFTAIEQNVRKNIRSKAKHIHLVEPDDEKIIVENINRANACIILDCENISISIYAPMRNLDIIGCRNCSIYSFSIRNVFLRDCSQLRHQGASSCITTLYSERIQLYDNGMFHPEIYINNSLDVKLNDRVISCNPFIKISFFFDSFDSLDSLDSLNLLDSFEDEEDLF